MSTPAASVPAMTPTYNPATGDIVAQTPELTPEQVRDCIREARDAQPAWFALPLAERSRHITLLRHLLIEQTDEIAQLISDCVGKTRLEALATEIIPSVAGSHWYQKHARRALRPEHLSAGSLLFLNKHSTVYRVPWGVVGIIAPWNYPLGIPMHEIVPALLAGNTVLFKTAPETLPVGVRLAELFQLAGLPEHVFTHINIDGPLCGDLFLEPGGVDKLFFTGSVRVGKLLMAKAAQTLTPVSLELGGKDAMIVCADADLERAVNGAIWAGLSNAGQSCAGVERLYVHESVYEPFMTLLKRKVETLRVGRDTDFNVDVGAICTDRQVETIRRHVDAALAQGATIFVKAPSPSTPGTHFVAPLVLTDVNHKMAVMREETFGPVLGVMRFRDDEEAIRLANDSQYGLTASVWSKNTRRAARLARRIQAGAVTINDHLLSHGLTETPWGGFKDSGMGRGHGKFAFEEMTAPQVVVSDRLSFLKRQLFWQPYSQRGYAMLKRVMSLLLG
jgi:acyl-CoA reductase-like NAD-dependent aldehyde dehydrogenase